MCCMGLGFRVGFPILRIGEGTKWFWVSLVMDCWQVRGHFVEGLRDFLWLLDSGTLSDCFWSVLLAGFQCGFQRLPDLLCLGFFLLRPNVGV